MADEVTLTLRVHRRWWVDPGLTLVGRVMPRLRRWPWLTERVAVVIVWLFVRFGFTVRRADRRAPSTGGDAMRLWRWLCCLTGHHRETVEIRDVVKTTVTVTGWYTNYRIGAHRQTVLRCVDCPHEVILSDDTVFTPSRRYALKRQGRAA